MARRIAGYGAGSVVAAATSEAAFLVAYGPAGAGPAVASAAGFVGGAVPNYFLNRRWAWSDRRGRDRRTEAVLYAAVALSSYVAALFVTSAVEDWARHQGQRVLLVGASYLAVSGVFFVVKFVLYHYAVFTPGRGEQARRDEGAGPDRGAGKRRDQAATAPPTTS